MKIVLAEREAMPMQSLWDHSASTVARVQGHLKDDLAYTTALRIRQKVGKKGGVRHEEEGCAHLPSATASRDRAQHGTVQDPATRLFKRSAAPLLRQVINGEKLCVELTRIRRLIDARRPGDKT
jgi:predicted transcriptional regulator